VVVVVFCLCWCNTGWVVSLRFCFCCLVVIPVVCRPDHIFRVTHKESQCVVNVENFVVFVGQQLRLNTKEQHIVHWMVMKWTNNATLADLANNQPFTVPGMPPNSHIQICVGQTKNSVCGCSLPILVASLVWSNDVVTKNEWIAQNRKQMRSFRTKHMKAR